jgi:hypothetical protein
MVFMQITLQMIISRVKFRKTIGDDLISYAKKLA